MPSPEDLFNSLSAPSHGAVGEGLVFTSGALRTWPGFHIGRSADNEAALLIETAQDAAHTPPPIRLQSLTVYHDALCQVSIDQKPLTRRVFTVLLNTGGDLTVRRYFLGLVAPFIVSLGRSPTPQRISEAVDGLAELFRALSRPPRKSTQGLWGELFVIAHAANPQALARVWHSVPGERFDFSDGNQRLEIKSASGVRRHHFALDQLREHGDTQVIISSVIVARATGGTSLQVLLDRVIGRLAGDAELQGHVYRVVANTLGVNLGSGLEDAFDEHLAEDSMRFFRAKDIPRVMEPVPPQLTDVRFLADITSVAPMLAADLRAHNGLFGSVVASP